MLVLRFKLRECSTDKKAQEKQENEETTSSPVKPAKAPKAVPAKSNSKAKAVPKPKKATEPAKRGTKRPPPDTKAKPQKKRKVAASSESEDEESAISSLPSNESEEEASEEEVAPPKNQKSQAKRATKSPEAKRTTKSPEAKRVTKKIAEVKRKAQPAKRDSRKIVDSDEEDASPAPESQPQPEKEQEDDSDVEMEEPPAEVSALLKSAEVDASESEMSVLIDEEPPPKKRRQKKDSSSKPTKSSKPKTEPKVKAEPKPTVTKSDLSPQEEEIKQLQSQLMKCGIRKMWHNELKNCTTPSAKVKHLKDMLKEAGMEGRFSEAKAREIKERRELEKDIEEAKDFDAKFGAREEKERRKLGARDWGIDESLLGGGEDDSDSD